MVVAVHAQNGRHIHLHYRGYVLVCILVSSQISHFITEIELSNVHHFLSEVTH